MDPFVESMLARARERARKIQEYDNTSDSTPSKETKKPSPPPTTPEVCTPTTDVSAQETLTQNEPTEDSPRKLSKQSLTTRISSDISCSPQNHLKTFNFEKDDFNMEIKLKSSEHVRVEVEFTEEGEGKCEAGGLREDARNRLKRLGKLYAGEEPNLSSPIHKTEQKFLEEPKERCEGSTNKNLKIKQTLANLAENINKWENENMPKTTVKSIDTPSKASKIDKKINDNQQSQNNETPKLALDKNVLKTLESQGFTRTTSNTKLIYKYQTPQEKQLQAEDSPQPQQPQKRHIGETVANMAAKFDRPSPHNNKSKDPALLSVAERKALFEKNKGDALVPKAAFGMAAPMDDGVKKTAPVVRTTKVASPVKVADVEAEKKPVCKAQTGIASKVDALFAGKTTISQDQIERSLKEQRQKEMDLLLNRFQNNKKVNSNTIQEDSDEDESESSPMISEKNIKVTPSSSTNKESVISRRSTDASPKVAASLENVKRIKVSPPKPGRLYPCLSDIEATTETEPEPADSSDIDTSLEGSDTGNTSFGREILQAVCRKSNSKRPIYDDSTESDISDVLKEMDESYLDEAAAYNKSPGPTPPKHLRKTPPADKGVQPSNSFNYVCYNSEKKTPKKEIEGVNLPTHLMDGENVVPLTHTVSFYRKQQQQSQNTTPVRQVLRPIPIQEQENCKDESEDVAKRIEELKEEINRQQLVIHQSSQALNLCTSTPEFTGSTEQVEAEKHLLVAVHRRQAALNEIQRLKVEGTLLPQSSESANIVHFEKGSLTISNICLPLKKEYVRVLAAAGGKGHHVVCLIKSGDQVMPTQLVAAGEAIKKNSDMKLIVPGSVTLRNICSASSVTLEVYCLQVQEEILPHEVKYHINNKKTTGILTPKKSKQESRMIVPPRESPGGPNAVRSPSFAPMGFVVFSVRAINRKNWCLNKVPSLSPLEGSVEMKIHFEVAVTVEHRGFLTHFEDVSGFGAWHRRWYLLRGDALSYWKYPDDEKKMPPINTIDLYSCITDEVKPVSRDVCARPNTVLLEVERAAQADDKDSLTTICNGDKTIVRYLLSADTKEERCEWCTKLNAAISAIRMWGDAK